jgi:uridine phosphorylase
MFFRDGARTSPCEETMTNKASEFQITWWAKSLNELDREIARLATICNVRILDAGVIERVLKNDQSVCGTNNPVAFDKLRSTLMMHFRVRDQAVSSLGHAQTMKLVESIVAKLRERIGERLGGESSTPS